MGLQDKYKTLVDNANASGVKNIQVREKDNVLYINGEATSGDVKEQI